MGVEQEFVILGMANKWELIENEDVVKNLFQHYSHMNAVFLIIVLLAAKTRIFYSVLPSDLLIGNVAF